MLKTTKPENTLLELLSISKGKFKRSINQPIRFYSLTVDEGSYTIDYSFLGLTSQQKTNQAK